MVCYGMIHFAVCQTSHLKKTQFSSSRAIRSNSSAADAAADNFSPTSHGLAPEFHKFVHEGYSSITDGMPVTEPHAKKLLVVGWCGDIQDLVDSLNMFAPGKTVVTVLCDCCPEVSASMGQVSNPKTSATVQFDCCPEVGANMVWDSLGCAELGRE